VRGQISYYNDELSFIKGKKAKRVVTLLVKTTVKAAANDLQRYCANRKTPANPADRIS
jgi:hypothetical protein